SEGVTLTDLTRTLPVECKASEWRLMQLCLGAGVKWPGRCQ
ncbi:hypothetical protein A2U01_0074606, partial [Trifolium medium]|nr:hypothetical protein [Trifolium medium]